MVSSYFTEPVSQLSVLLLKRVVKTSNFYAITKILVVNFTGFGSSAVRIGFQNFYQILRKVVQHLNFMGRTNFVSCLNYGPHSLLYNFEGLKCSSSVLLVRYYISIYI